MHHLDASSIPARHMCPAAHNTTFPPCVLGSLYFLYLFPVTRKVKKSCVFLHCDTNTRTKEGQQFTARRILMLYSNEAVELSLKLSDFYLTLRSFTLLMMTMVMMMMIIIRSKCIFMLSVYMTKNRNVLLIFFFYSFFYIFIIIIISFFYLSCFISERVSLSLSLSLSLSFFLFSPFLFLSFSLSLSSVLCVRNL